MANSICDSFHDNFFFPFIELRFVQLIAFDKHTMSEKIYQYYIISHKFLERKFGELSRIRWIVNFLTHLIFKVFSCSSYTSYSKFQCHNSKEGKSKFDTLSLK